MAGRRTQSSRYIPANLDTLSVNNPLLQASNKVTAGLYSNLVGRLERKRKKTFKSLISQENRVKEDMRALEREKLDILLKSDTDLHAIKMLMKPFKAICAESENCQSVIKREANVKGAKGMDQKVAGDSIEIGMKQLEISDNCDREDDVNRATQYCWSDSTNKMDKASHGKDSMEQQRVGDKTMQNGNEGSFYNGISTIRDGDRNKKVPLVVKHRCKMEHLTEVNVQREITDAVQRIIAAKDRIVLRKINNEPYISELKKLTYSYGRRSPDSHSRGNLRPKMCGTVGRELKKTGNKTRSASRYNMLCERSLTTYYDVVKPAVGMSDSTKSSTGMVNNTDETHGENRSDPEISSAEKYPDDNTVGLC